MGLAWLHHHIHSAVDSTNTQLCEAGLEKSPTSWSYQWFFYLSPAQMLTPDCYTSHPATPHPWR